MAPTMALRSLRWQLQLWYALLLVAVFGGFGATAWQLQRASRLREIDRELDGAGLEVLRFLRENDPLRGWAPGPHPRRQRAGGPREPEARAAVYFVAWGRDGTERDRTPNAPPDLRFPAGGGQGARRGTSHHSRGMFREVTFITPPGDAVVVGRSIEAELADLGRFAMGLTLAGVVALAAALAVGAWMAGRAMRPLDRIGSSARRIAAGSLADRIDTAGLPRELETLAVLLNEGFAHIEETVLRQRRFTSDASHELRTPVAVVLAQTQAALARPRQEAEYRHALEACQRSAQRMRRLVESLLSLARMESGEEPASLEDADLGQLAGEAIQAIRPLAAGARLTLTMEPVAAALPVRVDPGRMGQVLLNLLGNAVAYNQPGGSITVRVGRSSTEAFVRVADTGIGIASEHVPRLFERFYRVDASRPTARGHVGLGLAISHQIVREHQGWITVESVPGQGSTFTVWLAMRPDGNGGTGLGHG